MAGGTTRYHLHFTPTSFSWLNQIERWFAEITRKRIRRGTFRSVRELIKTIQITSGSITGIPALSSGSPAPARSSARSINIKKLQKQQTRGGVIAFTKSIAREGGPYNIRVNAITPAVIETEMLLSLPRERIDKLLDNIPLKRTGKAEEVAAAACFLASDASSFMTGEIMDVDGGLMMD